MRNYKILLCLIFTLITTKTFWYQELINDSIDWKKTQYIKVILDDKHEIITSVSETWESLESLVSKVWWISWVNWAYFCPEDYKNCGWTNYSENMRIFDWKKYSKYKDDLWANWLFWFDKNWIPLFILNNYWYVDGINKKYNQDKINDVNYWISNFPVLVLEWKNVINESENILDTKQKTFWIKSFICSQDDNKTIFMWTVSNITVKEMADFLQRNLNCYNAINLDSWGSLWMIYNNETIKKPWRKIMDAFVVVEKKETKKLLLPKSFTDKLDKLLQNDPTLAKKLLVKIVLLKEKSKNNQKKFELLEQIENYIKQKN